MHQLLGLSIFPERCHGVPSLINISSCVISNGKTGWGPTVQRQIAFPGLQGVRLHARPGGE